MISEEEKLSKLGEQIVHQIEDKFKELEELADLRDKGRLMGLGTASKTLEMQPIYDRVRVGHPTITATPVPVSGDSITDRINQLRIDLANTGDLAAKITGTPPPTSVDKGKSIGPLDHIGSLLDDCDTNARNVRLQLDKIYSRLAGG